MTEIQTVTCIREKIVGRDKKDGTPSSASETQGQLVGPGKGLNEREKNSGKKSQEDEACPFFFAFLTFLFPGPINCAWVSEDW